MNGRGYFWSGWTIGVFCGATLTTLAFVWWMDLGS